MKRRLLTRAAAADRLCHGSALLLRRWEQRLTTWVRAGRRDDLTGWRAALGPLLRLALLAVLGLVAFGILRTARILMWLLTAWWVLAAWRAGRGLTAPQEQPADATPEDAEAAAFAERRIAFLTWLEKVTRGRPGIHLGELHHKLTQQPAAEHLTRRELSTLLDRYSIPVKRTLRVDGIPGRSGVSREAVETLLAEAGVTPSPLSESEPVSSSGESA